jgi:hypothetical protein
MKIVTNNNYCVKCHLVGDYSPPGSLKALAPQLERVHERLRPDYVHDWIANPKRLLPYTGMPVNIPHDKPVSQDLYVGDSEQQVGALTDLLMHYDEFTKRQFSLEPYLPQAASKPVDGQAVEETVPQKVDGSEASGEQVKIDGPASNDVTRVGRDRPVRTGAVYVKQANVMLEPPRGSRANGSVPQVQSPL